MTKKYLDLELIDLDSLLDAFNIDYRIKGKDISNNFYGVECPFCPDGDHATHLGIKITTKKISCWRCGVRGTVVKYLMAATGLSPKLILKKIKQLSGSIVYKDVESFDTSQNKHITVDIPKITYSEKELLKDHRQYLLKRKLDPDFIKDKYQIECVGPVGYYQNRIVIPFFHRKKVITFITRDITGKAEIPYLNCPKELSIISPKEWLYNIENVKDIAIMVEGIFDVWNIGDGCVGTSGIEYTIKQLSLLKKVKRLFILFDPEELAQERAEKLAYDASTFVNDVNLIEYGTDDPATLTATDIKHLRRSLFGKIYTI